MRVAYNTACVKFRKDNETHTKAWCYINECKEKGLSYADAIAALIEKIEVLDGIKNVDATDSPVQIADDSLSILLYELQKGKEEIIKNIRQYMEKTVADCSIQTVTGEAIAEPEQSQDTDVSIDSNLMSFVSGLCDGM